MEMLQQIGVAMAVLGGLGAFFGLVLAMANRVFYVQTDPRLDRLIQALPGANCGGCGFSGCGAYAQAVLDGKAPVGLCVSGGDACAQTMASVMGVKAEKVARQVAFVRCAGSTARDKGIYEGIPDCLAATKVAGRGPLICKFGCLGFGNCTKACQFDAIHLEQGVAKVDPDKCTGCMSCAAACPRHIIVPVHYGAHLTVACSSTARGSVTLRGCDIGCIGCSKCQKACPKGAITVTSNLARVDYSLCDGCGLCVEVCPRGLISNSHLTQEDAGRILKPANPVS